jgi:hypothetical protein
LSVLLSGTAALAEDLPSKAITRAELIPIGWQIEAEASADFDADGRSDVALVLAGSGLDLADQNHTYVGPRRLLVAFGAENGYERVVTNNQFIPPADNPDMEDIFDVSADALRVSDNNLVLELWLFSFAGGWDMGRKTFTFHWLDDAFVLVQFNRSNVDRSNGELTLTSTNYATGTIEIRHGSIENDVETVETKHLSSDRDIALEDIIDGTSFDP